MIYKVWTEHEKEIIRKNPLLTHSELARKLPGRDRCAVRRKRYRMGWVEPHTETWKASELTILRKLYASYPFVEIQAALPDKRQKDIRRKAEELGLMRLVQNTLLDTVSWPGLEGGIEAYDFTPQDVRIPALKPPLDKSKLTCESMRQLKQFFIDTSTFL